MHTHLTVRFLAASCLILTTSLASLNAQSVPSAADEPVDRTLLSVFEVTTSRDIGYQSLNSAEVTRTNTAIADVPMNVTVFNQQFLDDILANETNDVLDYEASMLKTSENDGFLARGFSGTNSNLVNGFAQPEGFGSQSTANVERLEIIKGPAAVLYGGGGYGGTVNRVMKRPRAQPATTARVSYASQDSLRFSFDNTGPVPLFGGKRLLYRLNIEWIDSTTYRGTRSDRVSIAPSLTWNITERTQMVFEYSRDRHERPGGWAYPMTAGDPNGIFTGDGVYHRYGDRDVTHSEPDDVRRNLRQVAAVDLRHVFNDHWQYRMQFQYSDRDQYQVEIQPDISALTILRDAVLMPRSWRDVPRGTEMYSTRNELIAALKIGPTQHRLLAGHAWTQQYNDPKTSRSVKNYGGLSAALANDDGVHSNTGRTFNSYPDLTLAQFMANPKLAGFNPNLLLPINVFEPANSPAVPPPAQRPPLFLDTWAHQKTDNRELYFNDLVSFFAERLFWQIGMRHTEVSRAAINRMQGTFPFKTVNLSAPKVFTSSKATTYSTGVVWHLTADKNWSLYANANNSFEPEFRIQADGSALDPEEGNQKEAGVKFSLWSGRIQGTLSAYDIQQDNVTQADPENPGYFKQEKGLLSTGFEANFNLRLTDAWRVFGSYAYTDAREKNTGLTQDRQPKNRFTLFNRYDFKTGVLRGGYVSLGSIFVGHRDSDRANARNEPQWTAPEYWRFDVIVGYKVPVSKGSRFNYEVALKVKNALDNTDMFFVMTRDRFTADDGRQFDLNFTTRF